MVAIITNTFKRQVLDDIYTDVTDSANTYYIGIARSEEWNDSDLAPTPINSKREERNFRLGLQAMKSAEDISYVIPRYNWSSGTIYSSFDDANAAYPTNAYYVLTDENAVYICLQQGRDAVGNAVTSTIKPTGNATNPITTSDGYVWKYLYTIGALTASKFTSANYIPVEFIEATDSNSTALQIEQKGIQDAAIAGEVVNIKITKGGSGYTSAPTVSFTGNGTKSPSATATISGGQIVKVEMNDSGSGKALGKGYDYAAVSFSGGGGSGAEARAVIAPQNGLGADPRNDLKSTALMFNSQITGTETNAFITGNDFRQVGLIRNPKVGADSGDSAFEGIAGNVLNRLHLSSIAQSFTGDKTLVGLTSSARAYIDKFDSFYIWYHQTEETGFAVFQEGETVTEADGNGEGILDSAAIDGDADAFTLPTVNSLTGDLIYIDNRAAIERSPDQTEDIKVIIQL